MQSCFVDKAIVYRSHAAINFATFCLFNELTKSLIKD